MSVLEWLLFLLQGSWLLWILIVFVWFETKRNGRRRKENKKQLIDKLLRSCISAFAVFLAPHCSFCRFSFLFVAIAIVKSRYSNAISKSTLYVMQLTFIFFSVSQWLSLLLDCCMIVTLFIWLIFRQQFDLILRIILCAINCKTHTKKQTWNKPEQQKQKRHAAEHWKRFTLIPILVNNSWP